MGVLSEVVPISDLRHRPNEIIGSLAKGPVILTQRGRGTAVLMSIDGWKALLHQVEELTEDQEDMEDIRAADAIEARIARGEERTYSHEEVWAEIYAYHSGQMAGNLPSD